MAALGLEELYDCHPGLVQAWSPRSHVQQGRNAFHAT